MHWAELDENNVVIRVIVADADFIANQPGRWVRTHKTRKDYAGKGYTYEADRDVFKSPPPKHKSWKYDYRIKDWKPPKSAPTDKRHRWNEDTLDWEPE